MGVCECYLQGVHMTDPVAIAFARCVAGLSFFFFGCFLLMLRHASLAQTTSVSKRYWRLFVEEWRARFIEKPMDLHEQKIHEMIVNRHEHFAGIFLQLIVISGGLYLTTISVRLHVAGVWGKPDLDEVRDLLFGTFVMPTAVLTSMMIFLLLLPLRNISSVRLVFVACYIFDMILLWLTTDLIDHFRVKSFMLVTRTVTTISVRSTHLVVVWTSLHLLCYGVRAQTTDGFTIDAADVYVALVCIGMSLLSEKCMWLDAHRTVTTMRSSQSAIVMQELMGTMCDAVVYLDADLVITCPCPRFDTVFRKTHVPELRGELFSSFLEAGDRQRFEDFVKRGIDGCGQSLHVEITLDSDSRVSAQLFHRCFQDYLGRTCHIFGVLEEMDAGRARPSRAPAPATCPAAPAAPAIPTTLVPTPALSVARVSEAVAPPCAPNSPSSGCNSGGVRWRFSGEEQFVGLCINTSTQNLRILECTAGFLDVCGHVQEGVGLKDMVTKDPEGFMCWVQDTINHASGLLTSETPPEATYSLSLKFRQGSNVQFRATCTMVNEQTSGVFRCFVLSDVRCIVLESNNDRVHRSL